MQLDDFGVLKLQVKFFLLNQHVSKQAFENLNQNLALISLNRVSLTFPIMNNSGVGGM